MFAVWTIIGRVVRTYVLGVRQGATADAETKVPSNENPELSKVLCLNPNAAQNIALNALPTAMNLAFLISDHLK